MALAKEKSRIGKYGGGNLWVLAVTEAGPLGSEVSANWLNMGYVEMTDIDDNTDTESIPDETGKEATSLEGDRKVTLQFTLMQSDNETIEFLNDTVRGNYYSIYWDGGVIDAFHQEWVFPICKIKPAFKLVTGTRRPVMEASVLSNEAAINFDASGTGGSNAELPTASYATGVAAVAIAADKMYEIQPTAV